MAIGGPVIQQPNTLLAGKMLPASLAAVLVAESQDIRSSADTCVAGVKVGCC